ncbi:response regulator [Phormidium yuhuli AB48]|uniref:Response regulator n=1 Tax=Phormidium yuhuli AB48 TaxID=2940671 RepID=A0ABY5ALH6_9CYAN|nr:response regulator [Phormidium yuhuli]USR89791.1 response regulator [Phormidium yuhuli AB48]
MMDDTFSQQHPLRILLAEDNLVNQKVLLRLLKRLGYEADVANNGLEAVEAVRHRVYDVILMDIQMPKMDGIKATERIFEEWSPPERPQVIAVTANVLPEYEEACEAVGMIGFVTKPVSLKTISEALSSCQMTRRQTVE